MAFYSLLLKNTKDVVDTIQSDSLKKAREFYGNQIEVIGDLSFVKRNSNWYNHLETKY